MIFLKVIQDMKLCLMYDHVCTHINICAIRKYRQRFSFFPRMSWQVDQKGPDSARYWTKHMSSLI